MRFFGKLLALACLSTFVLLSSLIPAVVAANLANDAGFESDLVIATWFVGMILGFIASQQFCSRKVLPWLDHRFGIN